jgi:hypothetical protein
MRPQVIKERVMALLPHRLLDLHLRRETPQNMTKKKNNLPNAAAGVFGKLRNTPSRLW